MELTNNRIQMTKNALVAISKGLLWCVRSGLVIVIGTLYLARHVVYGALAFLMPAERFDRMGKGVSDSVADGLAGFDYEDDQPEGTNDCQCFYSDNEDESWWQDFKRINRWG